MSSINEILKKENTHNPFLPGSTESLFALQWLRLQTEKETAIKATPMSFKAASRLTLDANKPYSTNSQSKSATNMLMLFYALLQNHLNEKSPGGNNLPWPMLWLEKLKEIDNYSKLMSPAHDDIQNNNNNDSGSRENIQNDKNVSNNVDILYSRGDQSAKCGNRTITNENCNLRSRELWKKWSMETPSYEIFSTLRRQSNVSYNERHIIKNAFNEASTSTSAITNTELAEDSNDGGFKCARCGKMFSYAYYRDKHLKYTRCVDNGNRKFPCSFCSRSFEKRDRLRIHILHVHENHRPHVCSTCGKAFSQSSSLNKHLRVHSGERPYQCPFCTKCFTASSILRTHIRQHSGEKPFKCVFCGKSFASHAAHDSHVRRTHTPAGNV